MKIVTYSDDERDIIKGGITAIRRVLTGNDTESKERLLFCLDYYLDPFYGHPLSYEEKIVTLLQEVIVSPNPLTVKEDALNLLTSYEYPPFPLLENGLTLIEPELRPDIRYALNMRKNDKLLTALLDKCAEIFHALANEAKKQDAAHYGRMPGLAIIKYSEHGDTELENHLRRGASGTWKLEQGRWSLVENAVCHAEAPVSGMYYAQAGFFISYDLEKELAYLIYRMGPRFGRCFTYEVVFKENDSVSLVNEQTVWVS